MVISDLLLCCQVSSDGSLWVVFGKASIVMAIKLEAAYKLTTSRVQIGGYHKMTVSGTSWMIAGRGGKCVYECVCVSVWACVYECVCVHVCACMCECMCECVCECVYECVCIRVRM